MRLSELAETNRIQVDVEYNDESSHRIESYKGMVYEVEKNCLHMITDFGLLISIDSEDILNITKISIDKNVASGINAVRKYYKEKQELETRLDALNSKEQKIIQSLLDVNMLSKFNIEGAVNRMQKSMDASLFKFERNNLHHDISLDSDENSQIIMTILVSDYIEHYLHEFDTDKLIRSNAPDEKTLLTDIFAPIGKVIEKKKTVAHMQEMIYKITTEYRVTTKVTKQNFLEVRKKIIDALKQLKL